MVLELIIGGIVASWFFWKQKQQGDKIEKLLSEQENFRKRKHDYVIHTIRSLFPYFISTLSRNLELINEYTLDLPKNLLVSNELFDNKHFLLLELGNLQQILESQSGAIDPSHEKVALDICNELGEWQRGELYKDIQYAKNETQKLTTLMNELLDKLPNPRV